MLALNFLLPLALLGSFVFSLPANIVDCQPPMIQPPSPKTFGCAEANVLLLGLPPYHKGPPDGLAPQVIAKNITEDTMKIEKMGYNYMRLLFGPERDMGKILNEKMAGVKWDVVTVGYGTRRSRDEGGTAWFEDILAYYRVLAPDARIAFSTTSSTMWLAVKRAAKIEGDCTDHPGVDLGSESFCDIPEECSAELPNPHPPS